MPRPAPAVTQLFHQDQAASEIATRPTPALVVVQAEEPKLAAATEHRVGEVPRVFPFVDEWAEFLVDEAADRIA